MQRFFIDSQILLNETLQLSNEIAFQCRHVLRYKDQQLIQLIDPTKVIGTARLSFFEKDVFAQIESIELIEETDIQITLIQALIKKDKWEFVLQKSTECGVYQVVPLILQRNVVKWADKEISSKLIRDQKILKEAAEQSERVSIPRLHAPIKIKDLIHFKSDMNFVAYEDENQNQLKHALKPMKSFSIIIGPEGGFSVDEIKAINDLGFKSVGLGPRILRAETASIIAINTIQIMVEP